MESWQSAPLGTYRPQDEVLVQIPGDMGIWLVDDTASAFPEDGPTPNKAEILASGSDRYLKLTSAPGTSGTAENIWVVRHHLFDPLSIPLTSGKKIAIVQAGSLVDPYWSGWHPADGTPNGTCVYMQIEDNRGNRLIYLFQRAANYPAHTQTLQGYDSGGNLVSFGYHEILLGAADAAGGTYVRDLFQDFSQVPGFNATGASINQISYEITHPGTTTLRLLEIANQLTPVPPTVTTLPPTDVTASSATLHGTVNPNGATTTAQFEYGLTTAYGSTAEVTLSPNNGTATQNVSAAISGLQVGQTYHYRLSATNGAGPGSGADLTFTTEVPPLDPGELVAPEIEIAGGNVNFTVRPSVAGRSYQLQVSDTMAAGTWQDVGAMRVGDGNDLVISISYVPAVRQRFYRLALVGVSTSPEGFALIPAGPFQMGDQSSPLVGSSNELPVHTVQVSAFYMGKYEVTKEEWDAVRTWGLANGYTDLWAGNGGSPSKGANHPVHSITWYHMVKWCNARSQKEGLTPCYTVSGATYKTGQSTPVCNWSANGYRLPTEAEWEKAARGGVAGKNFPWGTNTISQSQANYYASSGYSYDLSGAVNNFHPTYAVGGYPFSSPVGSFAPNGYGLYDMAGNMWEWCWDWYGSYAAGSQTDPRGPSNGSHRVFRGGGWGSGASYYARCAFRSDYGDATIANYYFGFRLARGLP